MPEVSIIMPVYNGERYLALALDSILAQTFTDFEFIIIDDCSTDATPEILDRYDDPRIRRFRNETNLRITRTLNKGLDLATGTYIARMDADDIAMPTRLQSQVDYLERYPEVGLLGTRAYLIDDDGQMLYDGVPMPVNPGTAAFSKWSLLWATTIWHPSAMLRRELLERHELRYDPALEPAEDYDLWARISHHCMVVRLDTPQLYYRVNSGGISSTRVQEQMDKHTRVMQREISTLLGEPVPAAPLRTLAEAVRAVLLDNPDPAIDVRAAADLLDQIRVRFTNEVGVTPGERLYIQQEVVERLHQLLRYARQHDRQMLRWYLLWRMFRASPRAFAPHVRSFISSRVRGR